MLDELRKATEFAVDLEHHSYRTYAGFLCLMQVSTRHQDWIVDLLVLRNEMSILNEVFTDPKITKVCCLAISPFMSPQLSSPRYSTEQKVILFGSSKILKFTL